MLQPLLQKCSKWVPFHERKLRDGSSIRQLPHFQKRPNSDTAAVGVSKVSKSFKVVFVYHFVANSFTGLLGRNLQTYRFLKKM